MRQSPVNLDAVAKVLAVYRSQHPEQEEDYEGDPRRFKDTVNRALSGKLLTARTLATFVAAFGISRRDALTLESMWSGSPTVRALIGTQAVAPGTAAAFGPTRHRTVSVHEYHYLGADGTPCRHETRQVIEATVDGLDRYPYRFDTDAVTVEVGRGCKRVDGPLYEVAPGLHAVDIEIEPVAAGKTTTLEYATTFDYRSAPKPEFRRAARERIDGLNILVSFHEEMLPSTVWWARWESLDGPVIAASRREWTLDDDNVVQHYMSSVEDAVVGFYWEWLRN